jgi:hypothetical protein
MFVQASRQYFVMTTLCLRQTVFRGFQFSRVFYFLPLPVERGDGEQTFEAGVDANLSRVFAFDRLTVGCDEQAQIPTAGAANDTTTLDFTLWQFLFM